MAEPLIAAGYGVATLLSAAVLRRSLRARPRPGAAWLAFVVSGVTWWSVLSFGVALTADPYGPLGTLLARLEWFGIAVIAVGMVCLGFSMSGRNSYLSRRGVLALLTIPFVWTVVGLAHADVIGLARGVSPLLASALSALEPLAPLYVWLNPVVVAGIYLSLAVGTVLLLETAFERPAAGSRRVLTLLMVLPPWILNVLYLTGITPNAGYDPTVLGFVVTGVAGITAIDRFRLFETPFARSEVVEELDTPILVFGADSRLYDYNERAVSVLGLDETFLDESLPTVVERTPLSVDAPTPSQDGPPLAHLDGVEATVEPVHRTGDGTDLRTDGPSLRHYLLATTELGRAGGRRLGYAVHLSDVTGQRRRQDRIREKSRRLERKNEQLERLASIVAHDMESPVSTGQRLLDLLRMDIETTDDEIDQSLADLDRVLGRLEEFTEHLPRLARESIDVETPVECDLESVARTAWRIVDTGDLDLQVVDSTTLQGDPRRLQQVFENLFRNSVEHGVAHASSGEEMPRGGVRITNEAGKLDAVGGDGTTANPTTAGRQATVVRVGTLDANSDDQRGFYVADDGPGIPADRRDSVFTFGDGDGTGYGLAIVRTIVEAHGWSISATESVDSGARFEVDCSD